MGGRGNTHKRDQSDSQMPLRQSEIQASYDNQDSSMQFSSIRIESPTENSCINGDVNKTSSSLEKSTSSYRCRMEFFKTFVAFFCLVVSAFLNFFLLTVIHDIVPRKPLDDLVFFMIDQQRWAWAVGDVLSTVNAVVGFIVVLLHRERLVILRRVFLLAAILYGLRAIILGVTFLPPSFSNRDEVCQPQINRTTIFNGMYATEIATRFVTYVVTLGLTSGQEQILCGDLMFSGHTVVLTIMYFVQLQYTPRGLVILRYIAAPITFLGIAALVVSGGHYTMDVLIAYWLTSHVFWSYHQIFELPRPQRAQAPLSRLWWFWMCYWFEADVPEGKLHNEWNWPFSKPRFMHNVFHCLNAKLS
uniref:Sphingomyelin synthase-like domain-containing protein n=1 Tax=Ditylenchus dipsaci TaxID=166011 RepID=A0A915DAN1_9BILA